MQHKLASWNVSERLRAMEKLPNSFGKSFGRKSDNDSEELAMHQAAELPRDKFANVCSNVLRKFTIEHNCQVARPAWPSGSS